MKTETRHALKQDKFARAAQGGVSWVSEHRSDVLQWVVTAVIVVLLLGGGLAYWEVRSSAAETALGDAMDTYSAQLLAPGAPAENGSYATAAERTKAANQKFVAVVKDFGWLPEGTKAHYFAGVTYEEMGQNGSAETELKAAAGSWNPDLKNLAKMALAGLYRQTSRDAQAIAIYSEITAKPSATVPAPMAQLALADLYVGEGKPELAKAVWAKIKDTDKDGMAGSIASQKLAGKQQ